MGEPLQAPKTPQCLSPWGLATLLPLCSALPCHPCNCSKGLSRGPESILKPQSPMEPQHQAVQNAALSPTGHHCCLCCCNPEPGEVSRAHSHSQLLKDNPSCAKRQQHLQQMVIQGATWTPVPFSSVIWQLHCQKGVQPPRHTMLHQPRNGTEASRRKIEERIKYHLNGGMGPPF